MADDTLYPSALDTDLRDDVANDTLERDTHPSIHNRLSKAIKAIETELGPNPSAAYTTLGDRLDAISLTGGGGTSTGTISPPTGAVGIGNGPVDADLTTDSADIFVDPADNDFEMGQDVFIAGAGSGATDPDSATPDFCAKVVTSNGGTIQLDTLAPQTGTFDLYHDDTPSIQAALDSAAVVILPPIDGGYGVNAQWAGNLHALEMPANTSLIGYGYQSRLVRLDSYRWGPLWRLIVDDGVGATNITLKDLYIDGRVDEALDNWPTSTVHTTITAGTTLVINDVNDLWPTSSNIAVQMDDGQWVHKDYTRVGTTFTIASALNSGTSTTATAGNAVELAVNSQQYQCILFDGQLTNKLHDVTIDGIEINGWPGTTLRPKNVVGFRVSNCTLNDVNRGPLEITDSCSYGIVTDNRFVGCFDDGIAINGNIQNADNDEEAHHIVLANNVIKQFDNTHTGRTGNTCIKIAGAHHVVVANNSLEGGENTSCIIAWDSDNGGGVDEDVFAAVEDILIVGNELYNSSVHGIRIRAADGKNIEVIDNHIVKPAYCGIMIEPKTPEENPGVIVDLVVEGNRIYDPGQDARTDTNVFKNGIRLDGTACVLTRGTIKGNKIVRAPNSAIFTKVTATDLHIDDNEIYETNTLGTTGESVIKIAAGTVTRWTTRDNVFVNTSATTKPKYAIDWAGGSWTEGYFRGLIAYSTQYSTALLHNLPADTTNAGQHKTSTAAGFNLDTLQTTAAQTYAVTNGTTDRAYDANATTTDELADVLGTLIADLRARGLVV